MCKVQVLKQVSDENREQIRMLITLWLQTEMIQVDTTEISQFEVESRFLLQMVHIFHIQHILECLNDFKSHQAESEHSDDGQKRCESSSLIEDELTYISIHHIELQRFGRVIHRNSHRIHQHQMYLQQQLKLQMFDIGMWLQLIIERWKPMLTMFWNEVEAFEVHWLQHISDDDKNIIMVQADNFIDISKTYSLKTEFYRQQKWHSIETKSNHHIENKKKHTWMCAFHYEFGKYL